MTYVSPIHRAVPLPNSRNADDVPDAPCPSPARRGEFDYGHGEGVVRAMLPKSDPDYEPLIDFTPREPSLLDKHGDKAIMGLCVIAGFCAFPLLIGALNLYLTGAIQ